MIPTHARIGLALVLCAAAGCGDDPSAGTPPGGSTLWGRRFGKSTNMERVDMAVDAQGNVVVGGRFFATADFGGGPVTSPSNNWQAFVAKYDPRGALLWMRSLGDIYEEYVKNVGVDAAGNVYIGGQFRGAVDFGGGPLQPDGSGSDIFVAKLSPAGDHVWSKRFGLSEGEDLETMTVDATGAITLMGWASDGIDFGTGPLTLGGADFLVGLDASGSTTFAEPFPSATGMYGYSTALAPAGGGAVVVASSSYDDLGGQSLGLTRIGADGAVAWERSFAAQDGGDVTSIAVAADGGIFLVGPLGAYLDLGGITATGESYGGSTFVASLAPDGAPRWIRSFAPQPGEPTEWGNAWSGAVTPARLAAAPDGVVLTGEFVGVVDFGGGDRQSAGWDLRDSADYYNAAPDAFVLRLDAEGAHVWDEWFGDNDRQTGTAAGIDPQGNVVVAGSALGALPFATGEFEGTRYYEGFVVSLAR